MAGNAVPTYMHPDMFALRATKSGDGLFRPMELVPSVDVLSGNGADVIVTRDEQLLFDQMFYVSGEIPRVTPVRTRVSRPVSPEPRQAVGSWTR